MVADVVVTVERVVDAPRDRVFRAWTEPSELARWRGSPGWHVEAETLRGELREGGSHHHVKVRDDGARVATEGVYTRFDPPSLLVSSELIGGDPGIDPAVPMELRVELVDHDGATLVRVTQGPYGVDVAEWHAEGWERELTRLEAHLTGPR